jgi:hypothetical protein
MRTTTTITTTRENEHEVMLILTDDEVLTKGLELQEQATMSSLTLLFESWIVSTVGTAGESRSWRSLRRLGLCQSAKPSSSCLSYCSSDELRHLKKIRSF